MPFGRESNLKNENGIDTNGTMYIKRSRSSSADYISQRSRTLAHNCSLRSPYSLSLFQHLPLHRSIGRRLMLVPVHALGSLPSTAPAPASLPPSTVPLLPYSLGPPVPRISCQVSFRRLARGIVVIASCSRSNLIGNRISATCWAPG